MITITALHGQWPQSLYNHAVLIPCARFQGYNFNETSTVSPHMKEHRMLCKILLIWFWDPARGVSALCPLYRSGVSLVSLFLALAHSCGHSYTADFHGITKSLSLGKVIQKKFFLPTECPWAFWFSPNKAQYWSFCSFPGCTITSCFSFVFIFSISSF